MLHHISPWTFYLVLCLSIASFSKSSRWNVKSSFETHNLSQYWRMQKHREINIHFLMFHAIQTNPTFKMWTTILLTTLFESLDKLCCNLTPSTKFLFQQNCREYLPLSHGLCPSVVTVRAQLMESCRFRQVGHSASFSVIFSSRKVYFPKLMILANRAASQNVFHTTHPTASVEYFFEKLQSESHSSIET